MKIRTLASSICLLCLLVSGCSGEGELKVISFNIRYDNPADSINAWPNRSDFVADWLQEETPDLIGLQEVLWHQYEFLRERFHGYGSVAAGRSDGLMEGETCPVFFNSSRFELVDDGTFWLSETPELPGSLGPGAALPRITTWVELKEKESGRKLFFFNTHFSHVSDSARLMSAIILSGAVKNIAGDAFFVLTGDFNLKPESKAYEALTGEGAQWHVLYDSYLMASEPPAGPPFTFNGFTDRPGDGRIDYIFVPAGTKVITHETVEKRNDSIF
ncbi:MAG: endonuclease/exonuclease/phosphatase family protein, partial [Bacteroidales bacterium]|nr:endonuclease/exonuclease/phosphatase family protein [Bacteroidales bacterium]